MDVARFINDAEDILIFSGEGETGTWERYTGKRTVRAVRTRLTKERCGGDRWASVWLSRGYNQAESGYPIYDCLDLDREEIVDTRDVDPDEIV
jgi:hypothetical protein